MESLQGHDMWIVGKGAIAAYRGGVVLRRGSNVVGYKRGLKVF